MPMALKNTASNEFAEGQLGKPIDLVHLSTQTMGDIDLEKEVLSIFRSQSEIYLKMVCQACDATQRSYAAHSLKGVAKGIGAFKLAQCASEIEDGHLCDFSKLEDELDRVNSYIDELH